MPRVPHVRAALISAGLAALAHWTLAAHRPAARWDTASPLASPLFAQSLAGRAVDAVTSSLPVAQDVATGAWLVLALSAAVATSWLARLGLPHILALCFGVGLTFQRTPWSSHGVGRDGLVMLGLLLVAHAVSLPGTSLSPRTTRALGAVVLVLVAHHPPLAWLLAPLWLFSFPLPARERRWWAGLTVGCALAASLAYAMLVGTADVCVAHGFTPWLVAAIVPGRMPGDTGWLLVTRAAAALVTNIHVFGLVAAAWACWLVGDRRRDVRRLSLAGALASLAAAAAGAVPTETFVALALVMWFPWYALAGQMLWHQADGRWRVPGRVAVCAVALLLPIGRHAIVVPDPIATDAPVVGAHAGQWVGQAVHVVGDLQGARRAHAAGQTIVPMDRSHIAACLAEGRQVVASGTALQHLRAAGADLTVLPVAVPLTALLGDVRAGSVVAFGATSAALRWLRPTDSGGLGVLGLQPDHLRTRRARALVVAVPAMAAGSNPPHANAAATEVVATVGGRTLWQPLTVTTSPEGVTVEARAPGPTPLVHGRVAAIAVFDRSEAPVVRGTAAAEPGLPITLFGAFPSLTWARVVSWPDGPPDSPVPGGAARAAFLPGGGPLVVDDDTHRTVPVMLGDGWHDAEPAGRSFFRWSARADATANFRLERASPLRITIDAAPAQTDNLPNTLTLLVNGVTVGSRVQGATTVDVPASATRAGSNTLSLTTDVVIPPGVVSGEPRPLGAIVRRLRLEVR